MGSVPYRRLYIWFKPHGSKRDGMRKKSAPASMRCASALSNPMTARKAIAPGVRHVRKEDLCLGIAAAEQHELQVEIEDLAQHLSEDIEPLLGRETTDHPEDGHVAANGQSGLRLQSALAFGLARQRARAEPRGDVAVGLGIPLLDVDAVQTPARSPLRSESTPFKPKPCSLV